MKGSWSLRKTVSGCSDETHEDSSDPLLIYSGNGIKYNLGLAVANQHCPSHSERLVVGEKEAAGRIPGGERSGYDWEFPENR